jgi:hypothetical protein
MLSILQFPFLMLPCTRNLLGNARRRVVASHRSPMRRELHQSSNMESACNHKNTDKLYTRHSSKGLKYGYLSPIAGLHLLLLLLSSGSASRVFVPQNTGPHFEQA